MSSKNFAAIFPGQGSQHPGMGKLLYDNFKVSQETFEEASDALKLDLKKLCFEGTDADLRLTANTQPVLLVTSTAAWRVFQKECGFLPRVGLGHSLGEYSALVAAQGITLADAIRTVRLRGQAMQEAVPAGTGGMTAVMGMEDSKIDQACKDILAQAEKEKGYVHCVLEPANFNCPGQIVVSGHLKLLEFMKENLKGENYGASRVKMMPLQVSAPFHCSMMKPAAEKLKPVLEKLNWKSEFLFEIIHNVNAQANKFGDKCPSLLYEQVTKSVLWTKSIETAVKMEINHFVEFGVGRVLSGLNKKINPNVVSMNVETLENLKSTIEEVGKL